MIKGQAQLTASVNDGNNIFEMRDFFALPTFANYNSCNVLWKEYGGVCICKKMSGQFTSYVPDLEKEVLTEENAVRSLVKLYLELMQDATDPANLAVGFEKGQEIDQNLLNLAV